MKLKPCPFCGSEPRTSRPQPSEFIIRCDNPECPVYVYVVDNFDLPVNEWNTRAEEPAEKPAHWDINCDGYYAFCSNCGEPALKMSPYCPRCGCKMVTRERDDT